jgi:hypothetical protein
MELTSIGMTEIDGCVQECRGNKKLVSILNLTMRRGILVVPCGHTVPDCSFPRENSKLEENHCVSEAGKEDPGLGALKLEMHFKGS